MFDAKATAARLAAKCKAPAKPLCACGAAANNFEHRRDGTVVARCWPCERERWIVKGWMRA